MPLLPVHQCGQAQLFPVMRRLARTSHLPPARICVRQLRAQSSHVEKCYRVWRNNSTGSRSGIIPGSSSVLFWPHNQPDSLPSPADAECDESSPLITSRSRALLRELPSCDGRRSSILRPRTPSRTSSLPWPTWRCYHYDWCQEVAASQEIAVLQVLLPRMRMRSMRRVLTRMNTKTKNSY